MWYGGYQKPPKKSPSDYRLKVINDYILRSRKNGDIESLNDVVKLMEDNPHVELIFGIDYVLEEVVKAYHGQH